MEFGPLATKLMIQQYKDLEHLRKRYRENEKFQRKLNKKALRYDDFVSAGVEMYMRGLQGESEEYWKQKFEEIPRALERKLGDPPRPRAINEDRIRRERGEPDHAALVGNFLAGAPTLPPPSPPRTAVPPREIFHTPGIMLGEGPREVVARWATPAGTPVVLRTTPIKSPAEAAAVRQAAATVRQLLRTRSPERVTPRAPTVRRAGRVRQPLLPWTPPT